jgi:PHP family Zn ribbon phosphoesterase
VLHRVSDVADRPPRPDRPPASVPFRSIVPLAEIIASVVETSAKSKRVKTEIDRLRDGGWSEFSILLDIDETELSRVTSPEIVAAILAVRRGDVDLRPGYDGEYGVIRPRGNVKKPQQHALFT